MGIIFKPKRVLALAPHTDDVEFGCGGALARFLEEGAEVFSVAFSTCEESVPAGFPANALADEVRAATTALGIPTGNLTIASYPVRNFPAHRQAILEHLVKIRAQIRPDLVFLPCAQDVHQDHQVIAAEAVRAFKASTLLSYEMPWNNLTMSFTALIDLEERHVEKKLAALSCYKTQLHRPYANEEIIRSILRSRGLLVARPFAEAFQVMRLVF